MGKKQSKQIGNSPNGTAEHIRVLFPDFSLSKRGKGNPEKCAAHAEKSHIGNDGDIVQYILAVIHLDGQFHIVG